MTSLRRAASLASFLALAASSTSARAEEAANPDAVDVSSIRAGMKVLTDGKKHYLVVAPYNDGNGGVFSGVRDMPGLFVGDGKTFYAQVSPGGGSSKKEGTYWYTFWEPRSNDRGFSSYEFEKNEHVVTCSEHKTKLEPVPADEAAAMLATAKFVKPLWKRRAYWLARDEHARYYYVDVMREPHNNHNFRLFVGPKGNLKLQKMTNVVSDSKGDIFSTKTGELRLITQGTDGTWFAGSKKTPLTTVPVEDNAQLIYTDLGVYAGERLGTPCDDF